MHALIQLLVSLGVSAPNLSGVEIYSTASVRYGRWEFRMKAAATPGSVSSFFTYYPDSYLDSPNPWREIDIEILGKNGKAFQSNLITGVASSKSTSERLHQFTSDISQTYHTYTLDWTPDSVAWQLDGVTVRKTTASTSQQVIDLRDSTETYRMNLWGSNSPSWAGTLDTNALPVLQIVRWMRYSNYTPGAGPGGSNFTQAWVDSFKTLNTSRWAFGDWTFDGNYATFTKANAKVQDGHLILMLSTAAKKGQFPATFPHDSVASTGIQDAHPAVLNSLKSERAGIWSSPLSSPALEAYDLRGQVIARGTPAPQGQILDLRGTPRGVVLIRQGAAASWKILP